MMDKIPQDELSEILHSYNIDGLSFDRAKQVEPDMMLNFFHDEEKTNYAQLAADYLGGYEDKELPYDFEFDYGYPYNKVSFRATKVFSYSSKAEKKADGHIDDEHLWTKASTGDVCMLFACSDLKII